MILSYHLKSWHLSIFFRRSGRTCDTTSLECKQPKEVLLLISIFMINLCILHIKCLYCSSFSPFKCLNLNPIMPGVLRPDDLGWLTPVRSIFMINLYVLHTKCLYYSSFSLFKCLNLNPIMLGVLGPDDLGWLTLVRSIFMINLCVLHIKCLYCSSFSL